MNKDRLTRLENLLRANAANPIGMKFDLEYWARTDDRNTESFGVNCGTAGCAIGLAILSGEFVEDGLMSDKKYGCLTPYYDGFYQWAAVEKFFDLSKGEAGMFDRDTYLDAGLPTMGAEGELAVADRIRDFVNTGTLPVG